MNFVHIGGRRFVLTMLVNLTASFLQYMGKMDSAGNAYMLIILGTVGAYITGQAYETKQTGKPPSMPKEGDPQ
jgi:hypothetical protein